MITATTAKNSQSDNISGRNSYHKQYRLEVRPTIILITRTIVPTTMIRKSNDDI